MIWGTIFLIAGWITITPPDSSVFTDTTSVVLLEFSESLSIENLFSPENYSIIDADSLINKKYLVYRVGIIRELDNIQIPDTSLIALITERLPYRRGFNISAKNLKDKSGNMIDKNKSVWFFFNGYAPNKFSADKTRVRKK